MIKGNKWAGRVCNGEKEENVTAESVQPVSLFLEGNFKEEYTEQHKILINKHVYIMLLLYYYTIILTTKICVCVCVCVCVRVRVCMVCIKNTITHTNA